MAASSVAGTSVAGTSVAGGDEEDEESAVGASVAGTEGGESKFSLLAQQKVRPRFALLRRVLFLLADLLVSLQILTPADFALINSLKLAAATEAAANGGGSAAKRKLAVLEANKKHLNTDLDDGFLNEGDIMGPRKKVKENYEERMASIAKGREGRDKFGSAKGKKKEESHSSSTNKEKKRNKVRSIRRVLFPFFANPADLSFNLFFL